MVWLLFNGISTLSLDGITVKEYENMSSNPDALRAFYLFSD